MSSSELVRSLVRDVPDFPKPGILFKDITPVLRDPQALEGACAWLAGEARRREATVLAGIESRGFVFAAGAAVRGGLGVSLLRKKGKLPWKKISETYKLEYGEDTIEAHEDAFAKEERVLVVDDVLATGGTAAAASRLVEKIGAKVVGCAFVIELAFLNGRRKLDGRDIASLVRYA